VTVFTRLAQRGQRRTEGGCQARITLHAVGAQVARLAGLHAHRPRRHDRASLSQESPVPTGYGTSTARSHGRAMRDRNRAVFQPSFPPKSMRTPSPAPTFSSEAAWFTVCRVGRVWTTARSVSAFSAMLGFCSAPGGSALPRTFLSVEGRSAEPSALRVQGPSVARRSDTRFFTRSQTRARAHCVCSHVADTARKLPLSAFLCQLTRTHGLAPCARAQQSRSPGAPRASRCEAAHAAFQ